METKNKKGILLLLFVCIVLCGICLVEYALLSGSREQNRQLRSAAGVSQEKQKGASKTQNKDGEKNTDAEKDTNTGDGIKAHGKLAVKGTNLVDKSGDKVQLRGMSSHGLLWYPEYTNYASICETKKQGANMFRIAMYSDDTSGGYVQQPDLSWKLMQSAIENTLAADMYAIVDWHVLNDQNPLGNVAQAKQFFAAVSALYGKEEGLIYEICNEPNGGTTWEEIAEYANQVIPVIRANAPDAVILVGTPDYSYSITAVNKDALSYENLMYSYHFYAGQYDSAYKNMITDCRKSGIPIFVSEWGINTEQDKEGALEQGRQFAEYLNEEGLSFAVWSLCNKEEAFSVLKPECKKYTGWKESDLTDVGKIAFSALKGKK